MTVLELRTKILGDLKRFTLPLVDLKGRLPEPVEIRFMAKWCQESGRDVVVMTYRLDDGEVDLFCPIGWMNHEEMVLEGWMVAGAKFKKESAGSERESKPESKKTDTDWRVGRQMMLGE